MATRFNIYHLSVMNICYKQLLYIKSSLIKWKIPKYLPTQVDISRWTNSINGILCVDVDEVDIQMIG